MTVRAVVLNRYTEGGKKVAIWQLWDTVAGVDQATSAEQTVYMASSVTDAQVTAKVTARARTLRDTLAVTRPSAVDVAL